MKHYLVASIGEHRGSPRLWLQGANLAHAGFKPGMRFDVVMEVGKLRMVLSESGERIVSRKCRGETEHPVIDINSREVLDAFLGHASVRVVILVTGIHVLPLASEKRRQDRLHRAWETLQEGEPLAMGSLSHGGGILSHAIHAGLYREGLDSRLQFANEIRGELLDHAREANDAWEPETVALAAPLQELAFDRWAMSQLPGVDILEAGLPCSGASVSGRAKRKLAMAEEHPEVGHLVAPFLVFVAQVNPLVIVLENVIQYQSSASAAIMRTMLRDMGYDVHELVLKGREFGAIEDRDRFCLVAITRGIELDVSALEVPMIEPKLLGSVLERVPHDDPRWSAMAGLKAKQERDMEAGKGFKMQVFDASSHRIGTITKGYAKVRSTDPKIRHPDNPDLLRQITPIEHARVKQIPERLIAGLSDTVAHEVLGQSVVYEPFVALGGLIAKSLKAWCTAKKDSAACASAKPRVACG